MNENESLAGGWIWAFLIIALIFNGGMFGGGYGGNVGAFATMADVNSAINNQTTQAGIQNVLLSSANNNMETVKAIDNQTMFMMNQNNANNTNILQGFNALQLQLANLGYSMEQCCCSIKTLIKDNQIADLTNQLNNANNIAVNSAQSQYLLGQMGHWVANSTTTG